MSDQATRDGGILIRNWRDCQRHVEAALAHVRGREQELRQAHLALQEWMLPDDARVGEKIAVWHLDSLVQVEVVAEGANEPRFETIITIRKRGRRLP